MIKANGKNKNTSSGYKEKMHGGGEWQAANKNKS